MMVTVKDQHSNPTNPNFFSRMPLYGGMTRRGWVDWWLFTVWNKAVKFRINTQQIDLLRNLTPQLTGKDSSVKSNLTKLCYNKCKMSSHVTYKS